MKENWKKTMGVFPSFFIYVITRRNYARFSMGVRSLLVTPAGDPLRVEVFGAAVSLGFNALHN